MADKVLSLEELILITYHGIRSHQSYSKDSIHLKRAHDACEKALKYISLKEEQKADRNCDKDWFNETY